MSSRSLHRPSLIAPGEEHDVDAPRVLNLAAANHSIAATPFLITQLRPFVPFTSCRPGEPFTTKAAWKGVISGIRALQRLRITGGAASGPLGALKSDLVVISAHEQGHVMVWSADTLHAIGSCTHYNNVTVQQIVVTKSQIFTRVERNMVNGKAGDDDEVYVWDLSTMTLKCKLSGHEDRVTALAVLDEDENICVSGGLDKTILLWDVSHPAKPTGKLTGHNSSVTALLLSGHLLVSGSADGFIKTWNTTTKACIATIEGHQGIVTFLQWAKSYKDAIREMQKQQQQQPEGSAAEEEVHPFGVCIGACSGGVLRSYNCNKVELTSSWQVKAHRAFTTDVCWDDNIYISSSMAEPAINFYREGRSVNYKGHTGGEAGVRHLAIDRAHKVVMGGTDAGLLCFWSYKGLIGDADLDTDTVTLILSLQPHLGSISNLLLERAENSQWERLVSVSNDNTIFCMDFDVNRDSKSFHGVGLRCGVVAVPWSGSVVTASENNIMVWDSDAMAKRALPKKTFDGHTEPISALRFSIQASRLISGANDKTIRCWDVLSVAADGSSSSAAATEVDSDVMPKAPEELFVPAWTIDVGSPVTCLSEASSNVIVAGSRKANSKMGFVSVIDINSGNEVVGAIPVSVFPIAATVLVQSDGSPRTDEQKASGWIALVVFSKPGEASANASPERSFGASTAATVLPDVSTPAAPTGPRNIIVVVQLRTGEIQVATITASGQGVNTATPFRTIAPAQLEFFHGEAEDRIEMPSGYLALLDEKYDPPRVTVLYASDSKTVRKDEIVPPSATRPDISRTTSFATALLSKMDVLAHINQSGIYCAAGCDMGTGYLLNGAGEIIFKVRYDGGVIDVAAEELRPARSRRCYYRLPGDQNAEAKQLHQRFPGCTFIRATPEARSIAFGYNDGMVQIFDIVQRRVCRRISAHGTIIRSCFVMPATPRIVSLSKTGSLRFDTLYGRHVKHQGTTSASAVVAAFAGQS